jgi:succinate dehydrogenase / fumarate reductase cytochrome b subunit
MHEPDRGAKSAMTNWIPSSMGGSYRYFTGSLAYVLHRVSGLALVFFLFFHILSITKAGHDPMRYDLLYFRFQEADFKFGEIMLYGALLFHGINGMRLLLVDFVLERTASAKKLFWLCAVLIITLLIIGAIPLLLHMNTQALGSEMIPGGAR